MTAPLTLEQRLCNQIARIDAVRERQDDLLSGLLTVEELNTILAHTPARDWSQLDEADEQPGALERW